MPLHLSAPTAAIVHPLALTPIAAAFGWVMLAGAATWAVLSLLEQVNLLLGRRLDGGEAGDDGGASLLEMGLLAAVLYLLFTGR